MWFLLHRVITIFQENIEGGYLAFLLGDSWCRELSMSHFMASFIYLQYLQITLLNLFFFHLTILLQFTIFPLQASTPCVCCISRHLYLFLEIVLWYCLIYVNSLNVHKLDCIIDLMFFSSFF